jgi:hypothetical protein
LLMAAISLSNYRLGLPLLQIQGILSKLERKPMSKLKRGVEASILASLYTLYRTLWYILYTPVWCSG